LTVSHVVMPGLTAVMPALVAGIHVLWPCNSKDVDGRDKPGHDKSKDVGGRDIGVRKHAVLWTAMPGHDAMLNCRRWMMG
jgi:hypothetical protein